MIDVNTIVGDPVETPDGSVIMPVSGFLRLCCRWCRLPSQWRRGRARENCPLAEEAVEVYQCDQSVFFVVGQNQIRLLPVDGNPIADRLVDLAPEIMDKIQLMMQQKQQQEQHPPQQNPAI